jgi:hypothetical protein
MLTSVAELKTVEGQLRPERWHPSPLQDKNLPARCSRRSDCTHKLAPNHASQPSHWSTQAHSPEGSRPGGPAGPSDGGDESPQVADGVVSEGVASLY